MNNIMYYFTGTGNSLAIARKVADMSGQYEVIPVTEAIHKPLETDVDCIGVAFPVYVYRPPRIVGQFLQKLRQEHHGKYIFVIATCGGGPGNVLSHVKRILKSEHFKAGFTLRMPSNYLPFGNAPLPEHQHEMFDTADKKLEKIVKIVKERKSSFDPVTKFLKTYIHPGILYGILYPMIPKMDHGFWVENTCTGCKICADTCPVHNIVMNNRTPEWQHHCEQCWACVHWCPQKAIQYKHSTQQKRRYHHPEVSLNDVNGQKST
jgi:ferredoxin